LLIVNCYIIVKFYLIFSIFRNLIEANTKEFFFNNDKDSIQELEKYLADTRSAKYFELYTGRNGIKIKGKDTKYKKLLNLIYDVECTNENPENCY